MRVDLVLEGAELELLLGLLVLDAALDEALQVARQLIDRAADVPELVVPLDVGVVGKIALGDYGHAAVDAVDGPIDRAVDRDEDEGDEEEYPAHHDEGEGHEAQRLAREPDRGQALRKHPA